MKSVHHLTYILSSWVTFSNYILSFSSDVMRMWDLWGESRVVVHFTSVEISVLSLTLFRIAYMW